MKVITLAHDPGGANAVAASVARLRGLGAIVEAYAKGPAIRQFQRLGVSCIPVTQEHNSLFAKLTGDVLLTGTSKSDRIEKDGILWARKNQIPSIAVIDYWANYRQRFLEIDDLEAEPIFPDIITAIDEICAEEMVADGLPKDLIRLVGQPYFAWLLGKRQSIKVSSNSSKYILFASQPNANEVEILRILIEVLLNHKPLKKLLIRFHPRQGKCSASLDLLARSGLPFAIDESTDPLATICQQDVVLGITSIILLEAALMGIPAGSLLMGVNDTLMTNRLRITIPIISSEKLRVFLSKANPPEIDKKFVEQQRHADLSVARLCYSLV